MHMQSIFNQLKLIIDASMYLCFNLISTVMIFGNLSLKKQRWKNSTSIRSKNQIFWPCWAGRWFANILQKDSDWNTLNSKFFSQIWDAEEAKWEARLSFHVHKIFFVKLMALNITFHQFIPFNHVFHQIISRFDGHGQLIPYAITTLICSSKY